MKVIEINTSKKVAELVDIPDKAKYLAAANSVVISEQAIEAIKQIIKANPKTWEALTIEDCLKAIASIDKEYEIRGI